MQTETADTKHTIFSYLVHNIACFFFKKNGASQHAFDRGEFLSLRRTYRAILRQFVPEFVGNIS
jgi:hypothetical protein